ncbi:MAG: FKBP-type peptidyl-prolyl cis-trans isomerase [Bacteroidales bacterium]|nr:FKBP-type peptidyl-prolyl cis-trans isomerase [Bacteroidales bacterium]
MNYYIAVSYQLFVKFRGEEEERLQEQRTEEQPFVFITGIGKVLPPFEKQVEGLKKGDDIDFHVQPAEAFGEYDEKLVLDIPVNSFLNEKGELDPNFFYEGNIVPMSDGQGGEYWATIVKIGTEYVNVDLNHPRAGVSLHFVGHVLEHREATEDEVQTAIEASKCGCGGGCGGNCGGGCGDGGCGQQGCGGCCC